MRSVLPLALSLTLGCSAELGAPGGGARATGGAQSSAHSGGNPDTGSGATSNTVEGTGGLPGTETAEEPLSARTWRLSHEQYRKSVLDLVGREPDLSSFKPESGNGKFANFSSTAFVQVDLADNYFDVALELAEDLSTDKLSDLTSCPLDAACLDAFIEELGEKAFRSPVPAEAQTRLADIYELAALEGDTETGFRAVVAAILNSPLFLYRKEIGPSEDTTSAEFYLTSAQIAELLSYSLLDGPPPPWLRERAEAGQLTEGVLPQTITELMSNPAFNEQLQSFLTEWLEVTHFSEEEKSDVYPGFEQARPFIGQELVDFLAQSGQAKNGLEDLLLDPVPVVSQELEDFYYSDPSAPEYGERLGVLGLGSVLASHAKSYLTSPTLRGTFVRERFFCQEVTLPPDFTPPPLSDTESAGTATSTRELYEQHLTDPSCAGCHRLTDNIGFALEAYDGAGRFRTEDSTQGPPVPLDTEAELVDSDVDRTLTGAEDLSYALNESAEVKECFTRQAFRFYFGQVEASTTLPAIEQGQRSLIGTDNLGTLVRALLSSSNTYVRQRENQ